MEYFDVIIIGAGIEGSACAYSSVKRGWKTLLLEKFELCHDNGSSAGSSRGIRAMYYKDEIYTPMARKSLREWLKLEVETGERIYTRTGLLALVKKEDDYRKSQGLTNPESEYRTFDKTTLKREFPALCNFGDDYSMIYEESAGVLNVKNALRAYHDTIRKFGGKIHDLEPVTSLKQEYDHVTVTTNQNAYTSGHVILATSGWTNQILRPLNLKLPLKTERMTVLFWKKMGMIGQLPNFWYDSNDHKYGIFSTSGEDHPGYIKICYHGGLEMDPDSRGDIDDKHMIQEVARFINDHIRGVDTTDLVKEQCKYCTTPDNDYILDKHPEFPRILIAAGFSGHGFKMAPVIGQLMCDVISGAKPEFDITPFRIDRFTTGDISSKL